VEAPGIPSFEDRLRLLVAKGPDHNTRV
jgi:hypothetical protein